VISEYAFQYLTIPQEDYILDIDLDFFAPEMGNQLSLFLPKLQQLIEKAESVTVATSPYFLEQTEAITMINESLL
jgi:hypothetical protein